MLCSKCKQSADVLTDVGLCADCHMESEAQLSREHLFSPYTDLCFYCGKSVQDDAVDGEPCDPHEVRSPCRSEAFVQRVAALRHEGEIGEDHVAFETASEDAIATLNELILQARQLLGTAEKCQECGENVAYLIGCPDGSEVCQDCFNTGTH